MPQPLLNLVFFSHKDLVTEDTSWLKVMAADGMQIPCVGFIEVDVCLLGKPYPKVYVLVVKDPQDDEAENLRNIMFQELLAVVSCFIM